ncbi:DUF5050 domain-containing protein [Paenibacillus sonchi]|uniref:DUF5050 domain-containing protein n=1 Tax=Paenibacillus sonchi TaxID=373687 RepID=UPI001E30C5D6|nr:DUF5050 domain-containing protein [Paenibacillus sonchi]MCE3202445.1 DUF5050 domain-containing protein [Paenibacillus sonchi]
MPAWMYEMKKMFLLQKGLLFILLYFILSTALLLVLDKPSNPEIEMNFLSYESYLKQVQGPYTEKSERFFSEEAARISNAKVALQQAADDYYDGKMGEAEFLIKSSPFESLLQNEKGFQLIYDQYTYVREHSTNRYFLYTNGWNGLLATDSLDLLWILLILLLTVPVFCFEYESGMATLLLTARKGGGNHTAYKIVLALLTVAILFLLSAGLRYCFYRVKYGLGNGDYPLQSLDYFGTSTRDCTLFQAFLWITAGKLFGSICFATLSLFVSVCLKKYAITLFSCTAAVLLPFYGLRLESTKYFLPGPLGFLISTGYLRGTEYKRNLLNNQLDTVFREVSFPMVVTVFLITVVLCLGMLVVVLNRRTNIWSQRRRRKSLRKTPVLMLVLGMMLTVLSGCASFGNPETTDIYNYSSRQFFENERYRFYVDEADLRNIHIVFEDKETGKKYNFVRNPMSSLTRVENVFYGNGTYVYYMKYDSDESGLKENVNRFSVIEVDTTTFQEQVVFEKRLSTGNSLLLGAVKVNSQSVASYMDISAFFLDKDNLYFIGQSEIRRVNRLTGDMHIILRIPVIRSVAFDGRTIYYVNGESKVMTYDTKTGSETVIPDVITQSFVLTKTGLLFLNRKDQQKLYVLNLHDFTIQKLIDVPVMSFYCEGQSIFYVNKEDQKRYRFDRSKTDGAATD